MPFTLNTQRIPKKIHFIFLAKNETMPEIFNYCFKRAKQLHPDWEINFYNEDDALQIVERHFPELETLYLSYPLNIQRADILRMLLVYLYGGFYLDLDIYCLKKLDPLLKFNVVLGEEKHLKREVCTALGLKNPKRIANYMFGSAPKHPFWLDLLNKIMEKSSIEIKSENDVLESTGPGLLTDFYHSRANAYKDIVLLTNKDRFCLNESHKEVACHFGNYAAHLHTGTWRWQNGQTPNFNDSDQGKSLPVIFENAFRYKIENADSSNFYFNSQTSETEAICSRQLANAFKKMGNAIENVADISKEKVILYGQISKYMNNILPKNTYIYCSSSFAKPLSSVEVDFINNNFSCCIVPTPQIQKQYELNGVKVNLQIVIPGFRRYERDFEDERDLYEFKVACFATSFNSIALRALLQACKDLQKKHIPSIKIKLYDPYAKFKDLYTEFDESGIVYYTSVIVSEYFFSDWFKDLALAIFGPCEEPWPGDVLEFLYMGIPVIMPDKDNYKLALEKITSNPAFILPSCDNNDLADGDFSVENIKKAIFNLYQEYDHYSTNALNAAEELEDIQTTEETEQIILNVLSKI